MAVLLLGPGVNVFVKTSHKNEAKFNQRTYNNYPYTNGNCIWVQPPLLGSSRLNWYFFMTLSINFKFSLVTA